MKREVLDVRRTSKDTKSMLQLSVNKAPQAGRDRSVAPQTLAQLAEGEPGILERLELPEDIARRLMELGFLPGHIIVPARSAPGGEPRVYRVDGSEVALRRETASHLILKPASKATPEGPQDISD
jgi:ferrous iron transport protein A